MTLRKIVTMTMLWKKTRRRRRRMRRRRMLAGDKTNDE